MRSISLSTALAALLSSGTGCQDAGVVAAAQGSCASCHTDQDQLEATADPVPPKAEDSGEG